KLDYRIRGTSIVIILNLYIQKLLLIFYLRLQQMDQDLWEMSRMKREVRFYPYHQRCNQNEKKSKVTFVILIQYVVIKHLQKSTNKSKKRMSTMKKVGILVGSLRQESFTKKVAENVEPLFPDEVETEWIDIGKLPLYNQDVDNQPELPDEIV